MVCSGRGWAPANSRDEPGGGTPPVSFKPPRRIEMPEPIERGDEKPPSRRLKRYWKVAVLANIKDESQPKPEGVPPDAFADFDHIETIDRIRSAIEGDGPEPAFIPPDE